jgi:D-alanine-D-alanine ligase
MELDGLRIGFAYDEPVKQDKLNEVESVEAEYEDERTLSWIRATLQQLGTVIDLPWSPGILPELARADLDVIFNITEAASGRNRESLIPAMAEAKGIPCTGTDAVGLGVSLDKYLTKVIARHLGIPTPHFVKVDSIGQWEQLEPELNTLSFPVIAKPNTGGSSLGIRNASKTNSLSELCDIVKWVLDNLEDSVLVEEFIFGREFTVALFARSQLEILPVAEIRIGDGSPDSFYFYERKSKHKKELICPATPPNDTTELMNDYACRIFDALNCRDMARIDFRVGSDGVPYLLEINPLPGLSPYYSIFPAQAQAAGISPEDIIHQLIRNAMTRSPKGGLTDAV